MKLFSFRDYVLVGGLRFSDWALTYLIVFVFEVGKEQNPLGRWLFSLGLIGHLLAIIFSLFSALLLLWALGNPRFFSSEEQHEKWGRQGYALLLAILIATITTHFIGVFYIIITGGFE